MYERHFTAAPTADSAPPWPRGLQGTVWDVWPWTNWLIPIFVCFHGWLGNGGWETLALSLFSPIIVPCSALLGALPRFILRRRGHVTAPAPLIWLLIVNGWGWIVFAVAMSGAGDSGSLDSILRVLVPAPLSVPVEAAIMAGGMLAGILTWIVILILAIVLRPVSAGAQRGWIVVGRTAVFAVPVLLIVVVLIGVQATQAQRDAEGRAMSAVAAMPIEEQAAFAAQKHEELQAALGGVRALIAADGWTVDRYGLDSDHFTSRTLDGDCYRIVLGYSHPAAEEGTDDAALDAALAAAGWQREGSVFIDADGAELRIDRFDDGRVDVQLESAMLWGDAYDISERLGAPYANELPDRTYAATEWPSL
ncbi:hypothetical protein ACWGJP_07980 [Microbacterium sp. NPDC055903]